jgi:histidyl-tRNA synthetase
MKSASKSGARVAVIVGEDEKAAGTATIRDLTVGEQTTVDLERAVDHIRKVLDQ